MDGQNKKKCSKLSENLMRSGHRWSLEDNVKIEIVVSTKSIIKNPNVQLTETIALMINKKI